MKKLIVIWVAFSQALFAAEVGDIQFGKSVKTGQIISLTEIPFAAKTNAELIQGKAEFLSQHGVDALWLSDSVEAEKVRLLLASNPTDADLNYIYGAYLMRQGRKVDAMVHLLCAAEGDPTMVLYQIEAGRALAAMQSYVGALRYFERANDLS